MAYKLALPATSKVHRVFHVSQLKAAIGHKKVETDIPKDLAVETDSVNRPLAVLTTHCIQKNGQM